jgi:transcriptional regulator, XRE family
MGEKIKDRRKALGMTQQELAEKMGFKTRSHISLIEQGERNIPVNKIKKLAKILDISPEYLVGWANDISDKTLDLNNNISKQCSNSDDVCIDDNFVDPLMNIIQSTNLLYEENDIDIAISCLERRRLIIKKHN